MRKFINLIAIIAIVGVAFTGCQKENNLSEPTQSIPEQEVIVVTKTEEVELNKKEFDAPKRYFPQKQVFLDGGFVKFSNNMFALTVVVGDQRWIVTDYMGIISNVTPISAGGTYHYPYHAAMSLNGLTTDQNFNPAIVEKSDWRIPSWYDMNHLHHMVHGDEESIINGLDIKPTGMVKWDSTGTALNNGVHQNPSIGVFWNSDFCSGHQGQDTWHLSGFKFPDYVYLFQYQLSYPHAPIRLVQDVEPIQQ